MTGKEMIEVGLILFGVTIILQILVTPLFVKIKKRIIKEINNDED